MFFINSDVNGTLIVHDMPGKVIQYQKISSGTSQLDLSNKANGVYLLKVTNDKSESKTVKLVKK